MVSGQGYIALPELFYSEFVFFCALLYAKRPWSPKSFSSRKAFMHTPLKILFILLVFSNVLHSTGIVLIDPAGHAKDPGRQLHHTSERAEVFTWADNLKHELEKKHDDVRVVLTRGPGDEIVTLQNASFANRLPANLFIRLHLYKHNKEKPHLTVYYLTFDPILDQANPTHEPIDFIPVWQAHQANYAKTVACVTNLVQNCKSLASDLFLCDGPYGLPLKPLIGISAPALLIECGVGHDNEWRQVVPTLVTGITDLYPLLGF